MNTSYKFFTLIMLFVLSFGLKLNAQWSNNPAVNLAICDTLDEQILPKIASTSDGGCYISWFDLRSGNYDVYLQKLDPAGNKLWAPNGLLVSSNLQDTWITNYDLLVDDNDNAIIAFSDIRNDANLNPFVYAISPNGDFLWGANGIDLNPTDDFQANPKLAKTDDGNIVVAWIINSTRLQIGLQKISPSGTKLWGTNPIILQSTTEGYSYPHIVTSDGGGVILFHTAVTGTYPAQTVKLRAKKITSAGSISWNTNIQDLGKISPFTDPLVYTDNNNGGIISWHDDRDNNNLQSAFVQRVSSSGSVYFPIDGAEASLKSNRHKLNPVCAFDKVSGETYVFWKETDPLQNQNGISGQKFSSDGTRQWSDDAIIFKALSDPYATTLSYLNAEMGNDRAYLFFLDGNDFGEEDKVVGFACDSNGNFLWQDDFIILSNSTNDKLQLVSTVDAYKNCKLAWCDHRSDEGGIYAQDINPFGQLGNSVLPVELVSFYANVSNNSITLNWTTATELNNSGFSIERKQVLNQQSSVGNSEWIAVDFISGNGTTSESHSYSFADNNLPSGKYLYRLKQIDFDGSFSYSKEVEINIGMIQTFSLEQNYPNPFNPSTTIQYQIPQNELVTLKVYDILGNEVASLVNEYKDAGNYNVEFNTADRFKNLTSGTYFYRLRAGNYVETKKMILLK